MPEESGEAKAMSSREGLWVPAAAELEVPTSLPETLRPSREALKVYIPKPEIYNIAHPRGADFPHHGVIHGEETVILTAVLLNVAYEDVKARLGKERADDFRATLDEQALLYAAGYHDCGRITDWGLHKGEMQKHGPRGADIVEGRPREIDPNLSEEQIGRMVNLIALHTSTRQETRDRIKDILLGKLHISTEKSAARKVDRQRASESYDPEELMLRLLQEADKLGLSRGYYSRHPESPRRTPFSTAASTASGVKNLMPIMRKRPSATEQALRFSQTRELGLYKIADNLTRMSRRDPEINRMFANVPHRSGAAMETAWRSKILKP